MKGSFTLMQIHPVAEKYFKLFSKTSIIFNENIISNQKYNGYIITRHFVQISNSYVADDPVDGITTTSYCVSRRQLFTVNKKNKHFHYYEQYWFEKFQWKVDYIILEKNNFLVVVTLPILNSYNLKIWLMVNLCTYCLDMGMLEDCS